MHDPSNLNITFGQKSQINPDWDLSTLRTPCYLIDRELLARNLQILNRVQQQTGCKILLALKGFACWSVFDQCSRILKGVTCSALHEARLGREYFPGEVHLCAPAWRPDEMSALLDLADHIVFNSFSQWQYFRQQVLDYNQSSNKPVECGLRVNPRHSEVDTPIYDPCSPGSRLGITPENFQPDQLTGIDGLHFHTLCELNADSLQRTLPAFEKHFGQFIPKMKWINFGGGHHITRADYDIDLLCQLITDFRHRYNKITVYLEPGEAIALNTGFLIASVLDIIHNDLDIAILDTSASAHMPDVLEMPYRPHIESGDLPGKRSHTYRLAGPTCLAGDIIGDYSFDAPLKIGDKLIFHDMAHYTMVKNTMFNGINLPDIALYNPADKQITLQRRFGYEDFKNRLS